MNDEFYGKSKEPLSLALGLSEASFRQTRLGQFQEQYGSSSIYVTDFTDKEKEADYGYYFTDVWWPQEDTQEILMMAQDELGYLLAATFVNGENAGRHENLNPSLYPPFGGKGYVLKKDNMVLGSGIRSFAVASKNYPSQIAHAGITHLKHNHEAPWLIFTRLPIPYGLSLG